MKNSSEPSTQPLNAQQNESLNTVPRELSNTERECTYSRVLSTLPMSEQAEAARARQIDETADKVRMQMRGLQHSLSHTRTAQEVFADAAKNNKLVDQIDRMNEMLSFRQFLDDGMRRAFGGANTPLSNLEGSSTTTTTTPPSGAGTK